VEVVVAGFTVLNTSEPLPIEVSAPERSAEETELKYRYLQVRRPELNRALVTRARINHVVREQMIAHGFTEVETPCLLKSTPEGARDYLVPSRVHPGNFYALPQSPQLFKQLLMIGGMDRYCQIVRCFRDEDLRADRQPEFTQLDIEMSFVEERDVQDVAESLVRRLLLEIAGADVTGEFPRLTYDEAMERYGSDKPDLRFDLPVHDVSEGCARARSACSATRWRRAASSACSRFPRSTSSRARTSTRSRRSSPTAARRAWPGAASAPSGRVRRRST
jgi:aspartyl-tRNA synthetase